MYEELQIFTDDEGVKQLLVNDSELRHPVVLPGVVDVEREVNGLLRLPALWGTR